MPKYVLSWLLAALLVTSAAPRINAGETELKNAVILIIRHAEKQENGDGLTPAGEARARAYAAYFQNYKLHDAPLKIDAVFAAADSKSSHRPRLTAEPTAAALGLPLNSSFKNKDYQELVNELKAHHHDKHVLICWHHGEIPDLLRALGADPDTLLPGGHWPGEEYDWLIELRFDDEGKLKDARRVEEGLTVSR
jgi:broad specificity phosphatase PhoE